MLIAQIWKRKNNHPLQRKLILPQEVKVGKKALSFQISWLVLTVNNLKKVSSTKLSKTTLSVKRNIND
jgi:hypothetical protein